MDGQQIDQPADQPADKQAEIEQQLTGPGGAFELVTEEVLGERLSVFKNRKHSLREVLEDSTNFADADYLVFDDGRRYSYADNIDIVTRLADGFASEYGIGKGDRVAILAANCPEWIFSFWAAVSLGAIAVGLNGWWAGDEIQYGVGDCAPKLLVADTVRLERVSDVDLGVPVVEIGPDFDALVAKSGGAQLPSTPIHEDDPAAILYTSGTTGRPKGVVNTHRNVLALSGVQIFWGLLKFMQSPPPPERAAGQRSQLVGNPLFHVSGLYTHVVTFMMSGGKTVWTTGRFDPKTVMRLIEDEQVTGWSPMGSMAARFVNDSEVDEHDFSSVITLGSGGSPMAADVQERLRELFPNARSVFSMGYGLTECTALATLAGGAELAEHPDTSGKPLPTVEVEIRGDAGDALEAGQEGEICVRSPLVMKEYWGNPEATAEVIGPGRWLRTGDIGYVEDGRLYVNSRARDMILRAGENVYPVEIEQRLEAHPDVEEAAVVGVDHEILGQEVKAIVVGAAPAVPDTDDLADWVAETLAYYKVPAHWEIRAEALPRNASGKVLKRMLSGDATENPEFVDE